LDLPIERWARSKNVQRVTQKFPQLTFGKFRKLFTFANSRTNSGDPLVKMNFAFKNLPDDRIAIMLQTFRVAGDKLVLVDENVDKALWPTKT
jgi:hypothetical protein